MNLVVRVSAAPRGKVILMGGQMRGAAHPTGKSVRKEKGRSFLPFMAAASLHMHTHARARTISRFCHDLHNLMARGAQMENRAIITRRRNEWSTCLYETVTLTWKSKNLSSAAFIMLQICEKQGKNIVIERDCA